MSALHFDIHNSNNNYLDEKELFILYYLYRNKRISTLWSNVFVPNPKQIPVKPDATDQELFDRLTIVRQSSIVLTYLIELGRSLDEHGFQIHCNADYALVDGGFLYDEKSNQPIETYKEAVTDKKADPTFIKLVDKIITPYDGGKWDTNDAEEFLKIYYAHNRGRLGKAFTENNPEGVFHEDAQQKLARLLMENIEISLCIDRTDILEQYLHTYLSAFKTDKLDGRIKTGLSKSFFASSSQTPLHTKYFGYEKQKQICLDHISQVHSKYLRNDLEIGSPFIEPTYIGDQKVDEVQVEVRPVTLDETAFLFVHSMLVLAEESSFDVIDYSYGTTEMFDMYDRGFLFKINYRPDENTASNPTDESVHFDASTSKLHIAEHSVSFRKFTEQYHVLRTLFSNTNTLNQEHFFDEIGDEVDASKGYTNKQMHNYLTAIKNRVAADTSIKDLFITTNQSVTINPKYLK